MCNVAVLRRHPLVLSPVVYNRTQPAPNPQPDLTQPGGMEKTILITGGSGFIGSSFILQWIAQEGTPLVNLDKLTYAGNPRNLLAVMSDIRYRFALGDICDR